MAANFYRAVSPRLLQGNGWLSSAPLLIDRQSAENLKKFPKIPTDGWLSQHQLGFLLMFIAYSLAA